MIDEYNAQLRAGAHPVTITVTQEDIDKGVRNSMWDCPILQAIRRDLPGVNSTPDSPSIFLGIKDQLLVYKFMLDFDAGNAVAPIKFTVCAGVVPALSLQGSFYGPAVYR
mgnify:CR=1 FL=1